MKLAIRKELICRLLVSVDTSEKMEGATLKLGSIAIEEKIEDNLTEESLKTPWWAKLKKKHEDKMAADQDQEGRTTTEPTYSTFSWMEDTTEEISTKTPIFTPPPTLPTSTSQSNKPLDSSAMEENTTKGETFSQDFCCKSFYPCLPFTFVCLPFEIS